MQCIRKAAITAALAIGFALCLVKSDAISAPFDMKRDENLRITGQNAPETDQKTACFLIVPNSDYSTTLTSSQERSEQRDNIVEEFVDFIPASLHHRSVDQTHFLLPPYESWNKPSKTVQYYYSAVLLYYNDDVINLNDAP